MKTKRIIIAAILCLTLAGCGPSKVTQSNNPGDIIRVAGSAEFDIAKGFQSIAITPKLP